jgi:hypothetical protein
MRNCTTKKPLSLELGARLKGWLVGWLAGWLVGWLAGWLVILDSMRSSIPWSIEHAFSIGAILVLCTESNGTSAWTLSFVKDHLFVPGYFRR